MPELGEVEIARRNLERWWRGRRASDVIIHDAKVFSSGGDRFVDVVSTTCVAVHRRGKYLFVEFKADEIVLFHFRMTGKITRGHDDHPRFCRVAWRLDDEWLCFCDARRLGHIDVLTSTEFANYAPVQNMGPEVFDITAAQLKERVGRRGLKAAVMEQAVVAGVGNIAVSEVFWRLGLHPEISGADLTDEQWELLVSAFVDFFSAVIRDHQADEIMYVNQGGPNRFDVYGRLGQPCPRCGAAIERTKVAGRSSYYCPVCQRADP